MFKRMLVFGLMLLVLFTTLVGSVMSASASTIELELSSKSACLVDFQSGDVLFEKNAEEHLPIASMVKMMTILVTLEEIERGDLTLDEMITTSENASGMGGSQVFIDPYVEYSVEQLLSSVIIASANDSSVALAERIAGSEKNFVNKMNKKAEELGMNNTHYSNCTGLPAPEQYSCAKDCATVLKEISKYDVYHKYSTTWQKDFVHPSGRITGMVNTNRLVRYYDGCNGGKTGSTNEAGCCLSASATRNNLSLISVIIGAENSQTRFNECSKLFNYGFANYEVKEIIGIENPLFQIDVTKGKVDKLDVFANESYMTTVKKGDKSSFNIDYERPDNIKAPVVAKNCIGKAIISKNGQVIKEIELVAKTDIESLSLIDFAKKVATAW